MIDESSPLLPPECQWCGQPSTEQIKTATVHRDGIARPAYAWLCESCAVLADRERLASVTDGAA